MHTVLNSFNKFLFGGLKSIFQILRPKELSFGAEEGLEGSHYLSQLTIMGNLVDEAEPCSHILDVLRPWEFSYCVEIFGKRFDFSFSDTKTGKVNFPLTEL